MSSKYINLSKFMVNLAQDPAMLHDFKSRSTPLMAQAQLNTEEQHIVLTRDPIQLAKALKPYKGEDPDPVVILLSIPEL